MAAVSLKIHIVKSNNVKTMQVSLLLLSHGIAISIITHTHSLTDCCFSQFEESMIIYDVCRLIRERVPDAAQGQRKLLVSSVCVCISLGLHIYHCPSS